MFIELLQTLVDFNRPFSYAMPFIIGLIGVEIYLNYKEHLENYEVKDSAANVAMGIGVVVADLLAKTFALIIFWWIYNHYGLFKEHLSFTILGWGLLFFGDELSFYTHHRASHEVRILWAAHANHHSSNHYNLSTALRHSWTEVFYKYSFYMWLPLLGFHPLMILTQTSINLIYQFTLHTKLIKKFPRWIEFIFNTPSHHRVHHGSNLIYLDRNYGGFLIIWDRIFGSFQEELDEEPVKYGVTTPLTTYNPFKIASHEFVVLWEDIKKAPGALNKLKYVFYPPGWSHDGSTLTTRQWHAQVAQQQAQRMH